MGTIDVMNDFAMDWEKGSLSLQHIFRKIVWENLILFPMILITKIC